MKRERKVPFNCYLSVEQMDALDAVSERRRRPRAELIREAVARYLVEESATSSMAPEDGGSEGSAHQREESESESSQG